MTPKISVIIPVFNTGDYLATCIDSVLTQSFTDFELLLIDDGSTDDSPAICDEYAEKDSRIRVFHNENGGVCKSRNLGIDKSTGDWLIFMDSDDYWAKDNTLEVLLGKAEYFDADIIRGEYTTVDKDDNLLSRSVHQKSKKGISGKILSNDVFFERIICGEFFLWLCLIRRSALGRVQFNEERIFLEDAELYITFLKQQKRCLYIPFDFYAYRKHSSAITVKHDERKLRDAARLTDLLLDVYEDNGVDVVYRLVCARFAIQNYRYDISEISKIDDRQRRNHIICEWNFAKQPYRLFFCIIETPQLWGKAVYCIPTRLLIYLYRIKYSLWQTI